MLDAAGRHLPTVFVTALLPADIGDSLARLEPSTVLYKPFNKDDLLEAIARACG